MLKVIVQINKSLFDYNYLWIKRLPIIYGTISPIYKFIVITWTLKQVSEISQSLQKLATEYKKVNKSPWLMHFQHQYIWQNPDKKK
jgi:hypothetical protein